MENTFAKKAKIEDLEVTGVSRSGRVRKKSSKLMDFESPDEIDRPYKKQPPMPRKIPESPTIDILSPKKDRHSLKVDEDINIEEPDPFGTGDEGDSASDYEPLPYDNRSNTISTDSLESESEAENHDGGIDGGFRKLDTEIEPQTQNLFIHEPAKKRLVIKDGKIISKSRARKEKGKPHYTAYMLWSREMRSNLQHENPALDFAGMSRRLGELWSVVSEADKVSWRARAKRLNAKQQQQQLQQQQQQPQQPQPFPERGRGNLATSPAGPGGMGGKKPSPGHKLAQHPKGFVGKKATGGGPGVVSPKMSPVYQLGLPTVGVAAQTVSPPSPRAGSKEHVYRVSGIKPIDVAAHLKLLGESLTIIGERLKEHEGQIAVSGSLSVLLDSLLCALGPLLCLTQQIPELQENCCDPEQLTNTLDNVAFIMPGL